MNVNVEITKLMARCGDLSLSGNVEPTLKTTMDFFTLFGLPVQMKIDKGAVRKRFFELSRASHPDYFINQEAGEQQKALENSAQLNQALKTLTNDDALIGYVLQQKGLVEPEEKYALDNSFLMEMMELNEELAEAKMENDTSAKLALEARFQQLEKEIYEPVKNIIENYREGVTTEKELLQVKDFYFKKKYLQRLHFQLNEMS